MKRLMLFLSVLLLYAASSVAEQLDYPNFRFRHITVDDGLPSNCISGFMQDKKGFIWVNTQNGLCRYDGVLFLDVTIDENRSENILASFLFESVDERIWIGTTSGLYIYSPLNQKCTIFMLNDTLPLNQSVIGVVGDEKNVWVASGDNVIYRYSLSDGEMVVCDLAQSINSVNSMYCDSYGTVWVLCNNGSALYRWDEEKNSFVSFSFNYKNGNGMPLNFLNMFEDSKHTFWITSWNMGLYKLNRSTHELVRQLSPSAETGLMHIHSINEWLPGSLLIGSDDGLTYYDYENGKLKLIVSEKESLYSLSDEFIYPIFKDREGGLWVGTYYGGINYVSAGEKNFRSFVHSEHLNSVNGNVISRFCEDNDGSVWIASDDGGLNLYRPQSNEFVHLVPKNVSNFNVHALCLDGDILWVGTYDGGIFSVDTKTHKITPHFEYRFDLRSVYEIYRAQNGNIWMGTMNAIMLFDKESNSVSMVKRTGTTTICIKEDLSGNIWFATQGSGLYKYSPSDSTWKDYRYSKDANSLPNNSVNTICQDEGGELWIGTDNGLCRYLPNEDAFMRYDLGIPGKSIYTIIEDNHKLWLTTSMGLVDYNSPENYSCFTKDDGLQSNVFVANAGIKASDGRIYVGTVNGFNVFKSSQIHRNEYVPPVVLTQFELNNKKVPVDENGVLKKALSCTNTIDLSYMDNMVGISYAALSYSSPSRNQYVYMMEGFDTEWNHVGNQTKAIYSHLPVGKYVFKVKASNNDYVWNNRATELQIVVHPPFYFSPLFIVLYVLFFLSALGYLIYRYQRHSVRKHRHEIRRVEKEKEKEMDSARVEFFTTIAHEIRTPVSLITAPLEKIMKSGESLPESLREDMRVIERNSARLLFLVNQFLDFRKIEKSDITLNMKSNNVYQLLQITIDRFSIFFEQRGIHVSVECNDKTAVASVDGEALNIILSNLLSNANKYTKDKILLQCNFFPQSNRYQIRVTDNGNGFNEEEKNRIFKPFYQIITSRQQGTGIGLSIVKRYVEALGGTIHVASTIGKGATFTVDLPITKDAMSDEKAAASEPHEEPTTLNGDIIGEASLSIEHGEKPFLLIVEDNDEMLSFLTNSFADEYIVSIAKDGKEALNLLKEGGEINLIISDLMMPNMNGVELCKAVRENMFICHIPFVLLTAKTDMLSKVDSMNSGVDVFIEKPFSIEYLKACARNLVELRKMLWLKYMKMPLVSLNSVSVNGYDEEFLNKLNLIIEENFSNSEMSVELLAEKLCISRSKLFVKIKSLTNSTPNELIQVVRLKKAAELLLENRYRINEICYMVGFNNHSYFSKCFQKQFGVKPQDFCKNRKDEAECDEEKADE